MYIKRFVLSAIMIVFFSGNVAGVEFKRPIQACPIINKAPKIDAGMDDSCWGKAAFIPVFKDNYTGMRASSVTSVWLYTDGQKLYVFAKLNDQTPSKFNKKKGPRDKINWDETFEVFLAPYPDNDTYYQVAVTPAGGLFDNIGQSSASDHDFPIEYASKITNTGWQVELALPLEALGRVGGTKRGDSMHLNFCRYSQIKPRTSAWSPTGGSFHARDCFGTVIIGSYKAAADNGLAELLSKAKLSKKFAMELDKLKQQINSLTTSSDYRNFEFALKQLKSQIRASEYNNDEFVFWKCNPWSLPKSDYLPDARNRQNFYKINAMRNEFVTFAVGVANAGEKPVRIRCVPSPMFNLKTGEQLKSTSALTVRRVAEIGIRGNATQRDALPRLNIESILDVRSQSNEIIWLTLDTRKLTAGTWAFNLQLIPLVKHKLRSQVSFELAVAPASLPNSDLPYSHNWARYNWPPTRDILDACYQDQIDHYSNVTQTDPAGVEIALSTLKFDANGKLISEPDFSELQRRIDRFGPKAIYLFGVRYYNLPKQFLPGESWSAEQAKNNFRKYLNALYRVVDKNKIPKKNFVWYIEDEPNLERAKYAAKLAEILKELIPDRFETFVTFYRKISLDTIRTLLPYITLWSPSFDATPEQLALVKKHASKDARFLGYGVKTRTHHPYWSYRLSAQQALKNGYIGIGFWNYCDAGDSPTSTTWDDFEAVRGVSDYAVIYEGSYEPVPSVRWEAWRQGIIDYKYICWLRQLAEEANNSKQKEQALRLAEEAIAAPLKSTKSDTASVYLQKIREMIIKLLVKRKKAPASAMGCFSSARTYCLTRNGYILPNLKTDYYYTIGKNPHQFTFGDKLNKLTDGILRWTQGYAFFYDPTVIFDLKHNYKVKWLLINTSSSVKCFGSNDQVLWTEVSHFQTTPAIKDKWYAFKFSGKPCRYVKIVFLEKGRKFVGEVRILGSKDN